MIWTFWLYTVCALPWVGCLLVYGLRPPRIRSGIRTAMLSTYASLASVLLLAAILRVIHPPFLIALVLATGTLAAVALAGFIQLATILRLQHEAKTNPTPRRRSTDN